MRATEQTPRECERLAVKFAHSGAGTAQSLEGSKKQVDARLYALIRVQDDVLPRIVNKADRQSILELAASRLGDQAALQTGANDV